MSFISLDSVGKQFLSRRDTTAVAVRNFSLQLNQGEFFCLLGPSGCGKSTVLSMLAGFEAPSSGSIQLEGQEIVGSSRERCVVFQGDDSLYPWLTALENIAFGLRLLGMSKSERHAEACKYLELVGWKGQENKHPTELSGGMKQRIQIARALVNKPRVLLMDEPFGALDAQTRNIMQMELRKIWKETETTILFITHDVDEAILLSTRAGVMTAGPGGTLKAVVDVDLEDNRSRSNPRYLELYDLVHGMIKEEVARSIH